MNHVYILVMIYSTDLNMKENLPAGEQKDEEHRWILIFQPVCSDLNMIRGNTWNLLFGEMAVTRHLPCQVMKYRYVLKLRLHVMNIVFFSL